MSSAAVTLAAHEQHALACAPPRRRYGIDAKKWTRQQAIDYGIAPYEVERYIVYPGQACAYMIG
jgi:hypothetical protein